MKIGLKKKIMGFVAVSAAVMFVINSMPEAFSGISAGFDSLRQRQSLGSDAGREMFSQLSDVKDGGTDAFAQQSINIAVKDLTAGFLKAVNAGDTADLIDKDQDKIFVPGHVLADALRDKNKSVPALNYVYFNMMEGLLRAAQENNSAVIIEVARSQLGYALNAGQVVDYIREVVEKTGVTIPIVLHGDHIQYTEKLFQVKEILKKEYEAEYGKGSYSAEISINDIDDEILDKVQAILKQNAETEREAIRRINEELIEAGFTSIAIDASTLYDEIGSDAVLKYYLENGNKAERTVVQAENDFFLPLEWGADFLKASPKKSKDRKKFENMAEKISQDMKDRGRSEEEIEKHLAYMEDSFGALIKLAAANGLTQKSVIEAYDRIMEEVENAKIAGRISDKVLSFMSEKEKKLILPISNAGETAWQIEDINRMLEERNSWLKNNFGFEAEVGHVDRKAPNPRTGKMEAKMTHPAAVKIMAEYLKDRGLNFDFIATNNGSGHGTDFDKFTLTPVSQVGKISPWLTQEFTDLLRDICPARVAQHGTSGSDDDELSDLSRAGVIKFNIATIYQQTLLNILALIDDGLSGEALISYCSENSPDLNHGLNARTREKIKAFASKYRGTSEALNIYEDETLFVRFMKETYNWGLAKEKIKAAAEETAGDVGKVLAKEFKRALKNMDKSLYDLGHVQTAKINVLKNNVDLLKAAQTGKANLEHAVAEKADGCLYNHSEWRQRMEQLMELVVEKTASGKMAYADFKEYLDMNTGLEEEDIELLWQMTFKGKNDDPRKTARLIVNTVVNRLLKKQISYARETGYRFLETVVCLGETAEQRSNGLTLDILEEDVSRILEDISVYDAKLISLRLAYEPRWAIGVKAVGTPVAEDIKAAHRQIKQTVLNMADLGIDIDVDYGGSVKEANAREIGSIEEVNGFLIGGAGKTIAAIGPVIDIASDIFQKTEKKLHVGVNWKAEVASTGLEDLDTYAAFLAGKDLNSFEFTLSTPVAGVVREKIAETEEYLALSSPLVDKLINDLSSVSDEKEKKDALYAIRMMCEPCLVNFMDLFLINKLEHRLDPEMIDALRSRMLKEKSPDLAKKRVAVIGSGEVARLAAGQCCSDEHDGIELVAVLGKADELAPFLERDSIMGQYGYKVKAPAGSDLLYVGKQKPAVKAFAYSFDQITDEIWEALGLDVVVIDESAFRSVGQRGLDKLNAKGIQTIVSRKSGDTTVTYLPGMVDEDDVQRALSLDVPASDSVAAVMGVKGLQTIGNIQWAHAKVTEAWKGKVPPTYKPGQQGAYQTGHFKESRITDLIAEKAGIAKEVIAVTDVIKTQVPHGQMVSLLAGVDRQVSKDEVIAVFRKMAETSSVIAFPDTVMTSNLIWGEKQIYFNPQDVYVQPYKGGTEIRISFFVDEDSVNVAHILQAINRQSSDLVPEIAEPAAGEFAPSRILSDLDLQIEKLESEKKEALDLAKYEQDQTVQRAKDLVSQNRIDNTVLETLFPGLSDLNSDDAFTISGLDGKILGLAVKDEQIGAVYAAAVVSAEDITETQKTLAPYYRALRETALAWSISRKGDVIVYDNYNPAEKLRSVSRINAAFPQLTYFSAVEQFFGDEWKALSVPNLVIDREDYAGKYVIAVNGAAGRIGSLFIKKITDLYDNVAIIALGGPSASDVEYILKKDYVQGSWDAEVKAVNQDLLNINGRNMALFTGREGNAFRDPANYPWASFMFAGVPVKLVEDATGQFVKAEDLKKHLQAGAERALVSAPGKEMDDRTMVMNINEHKVDLDEWFWGSTASCTTGCLAQVNRIVEIAQAVKAGLLDPAALMQMSRGRRMSVIRKAITKDMTLTGFMETYHALTEEVLGSDTVAAEAKASRKRGASGNILQTTTGAAKAIGLVDLAEVKMDGLAIRFPTDEGSMVSADFVLEGEFQKEEIVEAARIWEATARGVLVENVPTTGEIKIDPEKRDMMATISPDKIETRQFTNSQGETMTALSMSAWYANEVYYAREAASAVGEVFAKKEVKDGGVLNDWGPRLNLFAEAFPRFVNYRISHKVRDFNQAKKEEGVNVPILINEDVLKSPDGIMVLSNMLMDLGDDPAIKFVLHINRDGIDGTDVKDIFKTINEDINQGWAGIDPAMFAQVVVGTDYAFVQEQVERKLGKIFEVIGSEKYVEQFDNVKRIILGSSSREDRALASNALQLGVELVAAEGEMSEEDLKELNAVMEANGDLRVEPVKVSVRISEAVESYAKEVENAIGI